MDLGSVKDIDDLYSGFDDADPALAADVNLGEDAEFQAAVKSSYGNRPIRTAQKRGATAMRGQTGRVGTARLGTRGGTAVYNGEEGAIARPMTANNAAGFRRADPTGITDDIDIGAAPPLEKPENTQDQVMHKIEADVNKTMVESAELAAKAKWSEAIDLAKKAVTLEKQLSKLKEEDNPDTFNTDLTYAVNLHLGSIYQRADMLSEALHVYQGIVKSKMFDRAGRLRANMGNIYFAQKNYLQAVKQYQQALDQLPYPQQKMRNKIIRNIGHAWVHLGQYSDALNSYEHVLSERPTKNVGGQDRKVPGQDFETAFNALLCYFALGDREKMKRGFQTLLQQELMSGAEDERYQNLQNDEHIQLVIDVIKGDSMAKVETAQRVRADRFILTASKLIAPTIDSNFAAGYDWCTAQVRSSPYAHLGAELDITKAISYLKIKEFKSAIKAFKRFEKEDSKMQSAAATNLSFLYFLESQYAQADKYADVAITADRYNPQALVNKGNCLFVEEKYDEAANFYKEALEIDSGCTEALYNTALCHKRTNDFELALDCFRKLHNVLQNSAEVIYQIAHCYELVEDIEQSLEWFMTLASVVPTDPNALAHLGTLFDLDGDKSQAFQYHYEAFRYFPSEISTVEWLGAYYVDSQFPEKAIQYFERAALVQPGEVKWRMMVASCHRRSGEYQAALNVYKQIHADFPEEIDCLKFLVRICSDLGMKEVTEYTALLKKAEKAKETKEQRDKSNKGKRSGRRKSGRDKGSAGRKGSGSRRDRNASDGGDGAEPSAPPEPPAALPGMGDPAQASYADPLGQLPERPKTAAMRHTSVDDDWGDDEVGDDLLPE